MQITKNIFTSVKLLCVLTAVILAGVDTDTVCTILPEPFEGAGASEHEYEFSSSFVTFLINSVLLSNLRYFGGSDLNSITFS